ncbi:MAG: RNA polymerase factor sigma-54 [Clostridioides sp.]|jgi:RNA polymerase sigma-54 factor|nr:RNA polymerase factor sigma-54 [Clostridioides sp.]
MSIGNRLELNQSQKLILTTEIKQSLKILAMSRTELDEFIDSESQENPLLEVENDSEVDWEKYIENLEKTSGSFRSESDYDSDRDVNFENLVKDVKSLYEDLKYQLRMFRLTEKQGEICEYIVDNLDRDGYLRVSNEFISEHLRIDDDELEECIKIVQQLEPSGVGARNISECLLIQVVAMELEDFALVDIIKNSLDLLARNDFKSICKKYHISMEKCVELTDIIKSLDPKPGISKSEDRVVYVQPDIITEKIDGKFVLQVVESGSPHLKINSYYREVLRNSNSDELAKAYIKEKLNSASYLMRSIEDRKSTVLKIAEQILRLQGEFFENGVKYIRPMTMKEVADSLEIHESTVSRGVNGKYILTPFGLFEFRYFFRGGIKGDFDETSSTSIKKLIEEIIEGENKKKPMSDEAISKILKEQGIDIARRTVAKYRESLGINSSSKRKIYG